MSFILHAFRVLIKIVERKYYLNGKLSSRKYPRWGDIIILVSQVTSSACGRWPRRMSSWSPALPTCWRASPSSTASSSPASPSSSPCPSCRRTSCSGSPPTPPPTPWSSCTSPWLAVCTRWGKLELFLFHDTLICNGGDRRRRNYKVTLHNILGSDKLFFLFFNCTTKATTLSLSLQWFTKL